MKQKSSQKGSALVYILIAIALLAALTVTFMDSSSQQTSSQSSFNTITDINSQANLIRSTIQECVLTYPAGDAALTTSVNTPYPLNPDSAYLLNPTVAGNNIVSALRCPGNPGNSNDHVKIFGGSSGKFVPPAPKLFLDWQYFSGVDGVFFYTRTTKTDSFLTTALAKLDDQFSECEADVVTGAYNMTTLGAGGPVCAAGSTCFRIWLIPRASARYQDPIDDAACP